MKTIENTGLVILLLGIGIFVSSSLWQNHKLSSEILDKEISYSEQLTLLKNYLSLDQPRVYNNSFSLNSALDQAFSDVNSYQIQSYQINDSDIELFYQKHNHEQLSTINLERVKNILLEEDDGQTNRWNLFSSFGSWLDNKEVKDKNEFFQLFKNVNESIKKFGIVNNYGFDQYQIKDLKFRITKSSSVGMVSSNKLLFVFLTFGLSILGALMYFVPSKISSPHGQHVGYKQTSLNSRGWLGIGLGTYLIVFYVLLYFYPEHLTSSVLIVDPVSMLLSKNEAGRFFLYGFMYTLVILVMGLRMILHYRGNQYQIMRTCSVMFFQLCFAFLLPELLVRFNQPYFDFKNIWPLNYDFFFDNNLNNLLANGGVGIFMLFWGILLTIVVVPVMVYFFGKRWYCSWVCGCGGLAETMGDTFRHLSDKSLKTWKIERWSIHSVLVLAVVMTAGVLYTYWTGQSQIFGINTYSLRSFYGAWIGAGFAGVVGTGFYPLMGNRVWCRFGCPLAAYLGFIQRFKSRFRITTNGGQCISCGNCSTQCEMGIDVRAYAQRGENIVRSSCVGCGICSAVCPRGVLKLENMDESSRFKSSNMIAR